MSGTRESAPAPAYAAALEAISADPKLTLYVARSEGRVLGTFQLILMPFAAMAGRLPLRKRHMPLPMRAGAASGAR